MATVSANESTYTPKERPKAVMTRWSSIPSCPIHPVFAGVDRDRLKMWSDTTDWDQSKPGFPEIYPIRYGYVLTKMEDLGHVAILADYDRGLEGVALAEMFDGKGSTLLCALELIPRIGVDPVADPDDDQSLVQFMASDGPHPIHRTADAPIKWGDYPSMQGFISGPRPGITFINTVWIAAPDRPGRQADFQRQGLVEHAAQRSIRPARHPAARSVRVHDQLHAARRRDKIENRHRRILGQRAEGSLDSDHQGAKPDR